MEFKKVKFKLNFIYTGSLLLILIIFITVLYLFISKAINKQEIEEIERFYTEERHEFLEEIYEEQFEEIYEQDKFDKEDNHKKRIAEEHGHKEHRHVKFRPERNMFYYVFDTDFHLIEGEETINELGQYFEKADFKSQTKMNKEIEWNEAHVLFIYYPIVENGETLGSVIVGKEITDEKHLIQKIIWILLFLTVLFSLLFALAGNLFAGQAMKPIINAFEKQRKFVSDASHELRTPLSIFYSSIDCLSSEENLSSFGKQVLEDAKHESEMMNKLLNDLLFLARNDQDNFELELEEVNLSELLHSSLIRYERKISSHLTFRENIQSEVTMMGDKVRLQQLIYILLDNAVRYTKEGSITCSLRLQGEKIELAIKDTGVGIAKEDLTHIFDRFYRGDTSRKRDGTGLGLSIAKTIVDAHGGKIEVNSEVGKGTEFIIKFHKI